MLGGGFIGENGFGDYLDFRCEGGGGKNNERFLIWWCDFLRLGKKRKRKRFVGGR